MEKRELYQTYDGLDFKSSDFNRVQSLIFNYSGIYIQNGKEALVRARLMKRMRKIGIRSFDEYLTTVERDPQSSEFLSFVDVLTTNKTDFFRENQHFHFLRDSIIPTLGRREVRWWSAGCSSGEEPVTLAISLLEELQGGAENFVKILATDISREVLAKAKAGIYAQERLKDVPVDLKNRYFDKMGDGVAPAYKVTDKILKMITYGRLNLNAPWPLRGPFQVIMCRNVLIYFKRETQQQIVSRFYEMLEKGGYLFLGHSESVAGHVKGFVNVRPSVYQKKG